MQSHHFMANKWGKCENSDRLYIFLPSKITADGDYSHEIKRHFLLGRKTMTNLDSILSRHITADKGLYSQSYVFFSSHVWMWELDCKEIECQRIDAFKCGAAEDPWKPLSGKEIKPINPKSSQP